MKLIRKIIILIAKTVKWFLLLILVLAIVSSLYNLTLPTKSKVTEILPNDEKAYIAELFNLLEKKGNQTWPGWGDIKTPVIVYNEEFAFLIGFPDPPAGWYKMPTEEFRGAEWELVDEDDFFGERYYKQSLPDPQITPENFTVKVGNQWVATMQTKEYAGIAFYRGFRNELPAVLKSVFPYRLFWHVLMGRAENYISGLAHEAFHALQGTIVPERLEAGENASVLADRYPWNDSINAVGWVNETSYLMQAYKSDNLSDAIQFTKQFIDSRQKRRKSLNLSEEFISYEKNREWLEGLAKYAELALCNNASASENYQPVNEIGSIGSFKHYRRQKQHFGRQIDEVSRTVNRSGESRFYYVGMLQATLLDKLMPEWKTLVFQPNVFPEDLLQLALSQDINGKLFNIERENVSKLSDSSLRLMSGAPLFLLPL